MLKVLDGIKLDFDDVLIRPSRTFTGSRQDIKLDRDFHFYHSGRKFYGFPCMISNMDCVGTPTMGKALFKECQVALHKHYSLDDLADTFKTQWFSDANLWYSMGVTDKDFEKLHSFLKHLRMGQHRIPNICVDVANGYMDDFVNKVAEIRTMVKDMVTIMAGNVCTPEMVQDLIVNGRADIVKIGIGPGSACETRNVTGVGYPQLSAIAECANIAHGLCKEKGRVGLICADGGCKTSGDIAKAYGAGADFVMVGGMMAGCDESEGEWEYHHKLEYNGSLGLVPIRGSKSGFTYYGMSSVDAQDKYNGGLAEYKSSEGRRITVPYRGPAIDVIKQIKGGLRSACSYIGASCLKDFSKCTTFIRRVR